MSIQTESWKRRTRGGRLVPTRALINWNSRRLHWAASTKEILGEPSKVLTYYEKVKAKKNITTVLHNNIVQTPQKWKTIPSAHSSKKLFNFEFSTYEQSLKETDLTVQTGAESPLRTILRHCEVSRQIQ